MLITAYINSACAFACDLPLWPERVVACRVSLSSVSSGCAKLLLAESGLQHTKRLFSSSEGRLYICKDKNSKHQILTCLETCCQNEKKFEREFA